MMTTELPTASDDLTERYVWAAVRTVPGDQREEVALELRERIGDVVQARVEAGESPTAAERSALLELGAPEKLAAVYVDRPLHLIGPRYYLDWLRLVKLLLFLVLPIVLAVIAAGTLISYGSGSGSLGEVFGAVFGGGLTIAVHMVFWTTLVFWMIERHEQREGGGTGPLTAWTPEQLPPVPQGRQQGRIDLVASAVYLFFVSGALVYQAVFSPVTNAAGEHLPVFDPGRGPWVAWFLAVFALELGFEVVLFRRGGWDRTLAAVNVVLNLALAVPAVWLLLDGLFNPAFFDRVGWPEGADPNGPLTVIVWVTIVVITFTDAVQGFVKTYRRRA